MPTDEKPLIDDAIAAGILLSTANEGGSGLYEAIWTFNGRFPDASLSEKYRAASDALRKLHEMGLIEFYREHIDRQGEDRFETYDADVDEVLEQPVHWYPSYGGVQVAFVATAKGEAIERMPL